MASNPLAERQAKNDRDFAMHLSNLDARFDALEAKLDLRFAERDAQISQHFRLHARWMLGAWMMNFLAILGLYFRK